MCGYGGEFKFANILTWLQSLFTRAERPSRRRRRRRRCKSTLTSSSSLRAYLIHFYTAELLPRRRRYTPSLKSQIDNRRFVAAECCPPSLPHSLPLAWRGFTRLMESLLDYSALARALPSFFCPWKSKGHWNVCTTLLGDGFTMFALKAPRLQATNFTRCGFPFFLFRVLPLSR